MTEIIKNKLFLGSMYDAQDSDWLQENSITEVLTVAHMERPFINKMSKCFTIKHHYFELFDVDEQNLSCLFSELFSIIDSASTILVHCAMGISRSSSVVIAYLMSSRQMHLDTATEYVGKLHHTILPNDGFIMQLIELDKQLFNSSTFLPNRDGIREYKQLIGDIETAKSL